MRIVRPPVDGSFLQENVSWTAFLGVLEELGDERGRTLAYDRGTLEIMSPSKRHERIRELLGRFVELLAEEMEIDIQATGSTTLLREDLERGVESDKCFYVGNEGAVRGKDDLDLQRDPPPDLAIEVYITRKSLDRFKIYAAMGVPEAWRYRDGALELFQLREGHYIQIAESSLFPGVPVGELARFLELRSHMSDTSLARALRAWVRQRLEKS